MDLGTRALQVRAGGDPSWGISYSRRWKDPSQKFSVSTKKSGHRAGSSGNFLFSKFPVPRRGVAGLEVERSVSKIYCFQEIVLGAFLFSGMESSQERRSPGWRREFPILRRWKDPSQIFFVPAKKSGHRAGGGIRLGEFPILRRWKAVLKISCSQERRLPGKDPSRKLVASRRGARRAGVERSVSKLQSLGSLLVVRGLLGCQVDEHIRHRAVERLESEPSQADATEGHLGHSVGSP